MHRNHDGSVSPAAQIAERPHRLLGIHVHRPHEPPGLVSADRQQRDVERPVALGDASELGVIARVAGEEHPVGVGSHCPTAPQRGPAIAQPARAEVLSRRASDERRTDGRLLPPVVLPHVSRAARPNEPPEPEGHEPRGAGLARGEATHRPVVQMVVVVVRQQHQVDRGQGREVDPGRHPAARAREPNRRRAVAPHRIGEHVEPAYLEQKARVPDPRHEQPIGRRARDRKLWLEPVKRGMRGIGRARPDDALHQDPLEKAAERGRRRVCPRIAEAAAGAVMRSGHGRRNLRAGAPSRYRAPAR